MKKYNLFVLVMAVLCSCSAPKYTYYFDHYTYTTKKATVPGQELVTSEQAVFVVDENTLTASAKENDVYVAKFKPVITKEEATATLKSISKEERKELKKEVKKFVKAHRKEIKNGDSSKQLENDVKLAAIFGAVGIVLLIIGGEVLYVLGAIALLVGLYFFIRWLIHQ